MNYNNLIQKIKQIVIKYTFGIQFIDFINKYTFDTQIQQENKLISIEFVIEIISELDLDTLNILTKISDFNKYCANGDLFNVWKIIYIKLYANAEIDKIVNNKHIFITYLCIPYVSLIYSLLIILSNISLASRI